MSYIADRIIESEVIDWLEPDEHGYTPLHLAASRGQLDQVPKEILTAENMLLKARNGDTPLHLSADCLDQVPKELLTAENMLVKANYGDTPLHRSALHGQLDQVPKEILTAENMLIKDNAGNTPLHDAAICDHLYQLPKELLTAENMLVKANDGNTPFDRMPKTASSLSVLPIETLAKLKEMGKLEDVEPSKAYAKLSKKIVDYLIRNTPYDPFDL